MKTKLIFALMLLMSVVSCKKDDDNTITPNGNSPAPVQGSQGNVNPQAVGKWLHGAFSMIEFWNYNGSYLGNGFEQSIGFDFKQDGTYEMFYVGQIQDFSCRTNALSNFKGYVNFTDSSFTVHPQQGTFKGFYSCTPQYNFSRPAHPDELKVTTYYYHFETDANGKKWMVIGFTPDDQYPSYFSESNW